MLYHCGRKEMEAAHINIHGDISGFVLHLVQVHVWLMLCYWQLVNEAWPSEQTSVPSLRSPDWHSLSKACVTLVRRIGDYNIISDKCVNIVIQSHSEIFIIVLKVQDSPLPSGSSGTFYRTLHMTSAHPQSL